MGFSRQGYWSGLPGPPPGDLPDSGIEPESPALQADCLPTELPEKPYTGTLFSTGDQSLQKGALFVLYILWVWHLSIHFCYIDLPFLFLKTNLLVNILALLYFFFFFSFFFYFIPTTLPSLTLPLTYPNHTASLQSPRQHIHATALRQLPQLFPRSTWLTSSSLSCPYLNFIFNNKDYLDSLLKITTHPNLSLLLNSLSGSFFFFCSPCYLLICDVLIYLQSFLFCLQLLEHKLS